MTKVRGALRRFALSLGKNRGTVRKGQLAKYSLSHWVKLIDSFVAAPQAPNKSNSFLPDKSLPPPQLPPFYILPTLIPLTFPPKKRERNNIQIHTPWPKWSMFPSTHFFFFPFSFSVHSILESKKIIYFSHQNLTLYIHTNLNLMLINSFYRLIIESIRKTFTSFTLRYF